MSELYLLQYKDRILDLDFPLIVKNTWIFSVEEFVVLVVLTVP
jgi:hypothetical protein